MLSHRAYSTSLWVHLLSPADRTLCTALVVLLKHVYSTFLVVALVRLRLNFKVMSHTWLKGVSTSSQLHVIFPSP